MAGKDQVKEGAEDKEAQNNTENKSQERQYKTETALQRNTALIGLPVQFFPAKHEVKPLSVYAAISQSEGSKINLSVFAEGSIWYREGIPHKSMADEAKGEWYWEHIVPAQ